MCLNHTMQSYISALGAHREKLQDTDTLNLLDDAACCIDDALHHESADAEKVHRAIDQLMARIEQRTTESDSKEQLVLQQIGLLLAHMPEITNLNSKILPAQSS